MLKTKKVSTATLVAAAEINLWIHRRLGGFIKVRDKAASGPPPKIADTVSCNPPRLADLGVTFKQSERWQKLAGLDELLFQDYLDRARRLQKPAKCLSTPALAREV